MHPSPDESEVPEAGIGHAAERVRRRHPRQCGGPRPPAWSWTQDGSLGHVYRLGQGVWHRWEHFKTTSLLHILIKFKKKKFFFMRMTSMQEGKKSAHCRLLIEVEGNGSLSRCLFDRDPCNIETLPSTNKLQLGSLQCADFVPTEAGLTFLSCTNGKQYQSVLVIHSFLLIVTKALLALMP